jgi:hypothetical protein
VNTHETVGSDPVDLEVCGFIFGHFLFFSVLVLGGFCSLAIVVKDVMLDEDTNSGFETT